MSTEGKAFYEKTLKELAKMAEKLKAFHGVETASVFYSKYHNKPIVYPNHATATKIFQEFRELSMQEQSENILTEEESVKQRIKKLEEEYQKLREENRFKELTIKAFSLKDKDDLVDMSLADLNDLMYVMKENLKQMQHEEMKAKASEEVPHPIPLSPLLDR